MANLSTFERLICWSCEKATEAQDLFCAHCGIIQPPAPVNHFSRLGQPLDFVLDPVALEQHYFELQKQLHPDRFVTKTARERTLALQQSMSVNESYQVLKSPLKRAEYLLELKDMPVNKEEGGISPETELLMEMMDLQEDIADAVLPSETTQISEDVEILIKETLSALAEGFRQSHLHEAAQLTIRLKYLLKALEDVKRRQHKTTRKVS